jgi:hypothetical protein
MLDCGKVEVTGLGEVLKVEESVELAAAVEGDIVLEDALTCLNGPKGAHSGGMSAGFTS